MGSARRTAKRKATLVNLNALLLLLLLLLCGVVVCCGCMLWLCVVVVCCGCVWLLRSILVLLFSLSEVAALVVDHGSGLFSTGFAGEDALRAVFPTFGLSQNGEVCTVDASAAEQFFLENLDNNSMSPLYFCSLFSSRHIAPGDFLGPSTTKSSSLSRARGWRGRRVPPTSLSGSLHR